MEQVFPRDEAIQQEVLDELRWDKRIRPNEIGVVVTDGIVTLSGTVDSYLTHWSAEECALRIRGVRAVANEIEIRTPGSAERNDTDLAAAIVQSLAWDSYIPAGRISVSVSKGWVTLKGEVEWREQKEDAERVIRRLAGVRGITNVIRVQQPLPAVADLEIKEDIENALSRAVAIDSARILVIVHDKRVALRGHVRSAFEKIEAARIAWSASGVLDVSNRLTVDIRPERARSEEDEVDEEDRDEEIEREAPVENEDLLVQPTPWQD